ncbi:MAG: class I SAM-dependent methyltransferase [Acidobacteria bacterium]|nr:class I SAM-dependent methyltransferase [Acidobacteriota bacterium]MDW7983983.1 class I SAM-dependent methyltransferase [Acidobacteriota bacterium]
MRRLLIVGRVLFVCGLLPPLVVPVLAQANRDAWQKPDEVIRALGLKPGQVVADLGAGKGYFTFRLAAAVRPGGRVIAQDIDAAALRTILRQARMLAREASDTAEAPNVDVVLGLPDYTGIASDMVDVAFICNVYHHVRDRATWVRDVYRIVKSGGRVVLIDFYKRPTPGPPLAMRIPEDQARREWEAGGFRHVETLTFLPYQYMMVLEKP